MERGEPAKKGRSIGQIAALSLSLFLSSDRRRSIVSTCPERAVDVERSEAVGHAAQGCPAYEKRQDEATACARRERLAGDR